MSRQNDEKLLATGDYVRDAVHGVVPKDVPTAIRLRQEKLAAAAEQVEDETPASEPVEKPATTPAPVVPKVPGTIPNTPAQPQP